MVLFVSLVAMCSYGTVIVQQEAWGTDEAGWALGASSLASLAQTNIGGAHGGVLQLTLSDLGYAYVDATESSAASRFVGDLYTPYSGQLAVSFDFRAVQGDAPSTFYMSMWSGNGTREWRHYFTGVETTDWVTYGFNMSDALQWSPEDGGTFLSDFMDVDKISLFVLDSAGSSQYQFDNFTYTVPEPETVWMILAVVMSMAITFRGQLVKVFSGIKSRIAA
jgi:hypothetical protein